MPPDQMPSKVMVFAAGLGTRMRPLTLTTPKPMIRVAGKPLMDHMLDRFAADGVAEAVVNVHYLADQIAAHLASRTEPKIAISDERDKLLDQGGGIRKALPLLGGEPFFICNTDAFWVEGPRSNLARLAEAWDPSAMDILLLVAGTTTSVGIDWTGDFDLAPDGRLSKRKEREVAAFAYTGVGILKPMLFAGDQPEVFRLAPLFFRAAEAGRLFGVRLDGLWMHVGTPEAVAEAESAVERSVR